MKSNLSRFAFVLLLLTVLLGACSPAQRVVYITATPRVIYVTATPALLTQPQASVPTPVVSVDLTDIGAAYQEFSAVDASLYRAFDQLQNAPEWQAFWAEENDCTASLKSLADVARPYFFWSARQWNILANKVDPRITLSNDVITVTGETVSLDDAALGSGVVAEQYPLEWPGATSPADIAYLNCSAADFEMVDEAAMQQFADAVIPARDMLGTLLADNVSGTSREEYIAYSDQLRSLLQVLLLPVLNRYW